MIIKVEAIRSEVFGLRMQVTTENIGEHYILNAVSFKVKDLLVAVSKKISFSMDFKDLKKLEVHRKDKGYKVPWLMRDKRNYWEMSDNYTLIIPIEYADGFKYVGEAEDFVAKDMDRDYIHTYGVYEFNVLSYIDEGTTPWDRNFTANGGVATLLALKSIRNTKEFEYAEKMLNDIRKTCGYTGIDLFAIKQLLKHYRLVKKRK